MRLTGTPKPKNPSDTVKTLSCTIDAEMRFWHLMGTSNAKTLNPFHPGPFGMLTLLIPFLFTTLAFAIFLFYFVWHNRFATKIRLAIQERGGRVISIKRTVEAQKNLRNENHPEVLVNRVAWYILYKDKYENIHETQCRIIDDQPHWHPPLR
jgi:hypothetical protein